MTGQVFERSATSILLLLIPIAFVLVLLYSVWPLLLAIVAAGIGLNIWQKYRWQQWSKQVTPYFNQLIGENQGCLTPFDLAMKANLTAAAAQRFLDRKAVEYGAQRKDYKEGGTVYYFLTASALGTMFRDSEPQGDRDSEALSLEEVEELIPAPTTKAQALVEPPPAEPFPSASPAPEASPAPSPDPSPAPAAPMADAAPEATAPAASQSPRSLIQAELAKRLAVHSGTITKRKSDADFPQWTQSRDPEGIAWQYSSSQKVFTPVEG